MSTNSTHFEWDLFPLTASNPIWQEDSAKPHTEGTGKKVLVVGTTSDYVDLLRLRNPGRVLYLTAQSERCKAQESKPLDHEEIVCNIEEDVSLILQRIQAHTHLWNSSIDGIFCFDCESMELAAKLAEGLSLPYPTLDSIRLCRDKSVTKTIWREKGISCPRHRLVQTAAEVEAFLQEVNGPIVLKPLSGSGSELVFLCFNRKECEEATHAILEGLEVRKEVRLYNKATTRFVAEEFASGTEFSCDFNIKGGRVEILRLTRKIKITKKPFGTIDGYMITDWRRSGINQNHLATIFKQGAEALGFINAICMVDFIIDGNKILLLEMTPRPGGDCIPFLLQRAVGFDILSYCIDFSRNHFEAVPVTRISGEGLVALRLHADRSGTIAKIDSSSLFLDARVRELCLVKKGGHQVTMPPLDYDSWYFGYVLFQPVAGILVDEQCKELRRLLEVEMENDNN